MPDDKQLREIYSGDSSAGSDRSPTPGSHLEADDWERISCGEMPATERRRAVDHITGCSECGRIFRTLSVFEDEVRAVDALVPKTGLAAEPPRTPMRFVWPALAAAAALVFLIALPNNTPIETSDGTSPGSTLRNGLEASRPQPIAPIGDLASPPSALTWQSVDDASGYRVELLSGNGELLWESATAGETSVLLPNGVADSPSQYFWRVLVLPLGGGEPTASELVAFNVQPDR